MRFDKHPGGGGAAAKRNYILLVEIGVFEDDTEELSREALDGSERVGLFGDSRNELRGYVLYDIAAPLVVVRELGRHVRSAQQLLECAKVPLLVDKGFTKGVLLFPARGEGQLELLLRLGNMDAPSLWRALGLVDTRGTVLNKVS